MLCLLQRDMHTVFPDLYPFFVCVCAEQHSTARNTSFRGPVIACDLACRLGDATPLLTIPIVNSYYQPVNLSDKENALHTHTHAHRAVQDKPC